jgi:hypothetical protein
MGINVLTNRYENSRLGANDDETILTSMNRTGLSATT